MVIAIVIVLLAVIPGSARSDPPSLTVVSVEPDYDSVKINFSPVTGARDYRVFNINNPARVKYAGQWHINAGYGQEFAKDSHGNVVYPLTCVSSVAASPTVYDTVPATQIEWNAMVPGATETLVVQAVGAVGPAAPGNLPDANNMPLIPSSEDGMSMLGSDEGDTIDGNLSINGQGSYQNLVNVIAQSAPFTVTATGKPVLPSMEGVTQVTFDPFEKGTFTKNRDVDTRNGIESWNLQAAEQWTVQAFGVDTNNTRPFVMDEHFMDVLFDGNTAHTNQPLHNNHADLALSPVKTADFSNGRILHMTMEVDAQVDSRRWVDFNIAPATDPITSFYSVNGAINRTDTAVFFEIENDVKVTQFVGPSVPGTPNSPPISVNLAGAAGQARLVDSRPSKLPDGVDFQNGRGLDDRSRFDAYISQSHYAIYEDGINVAEGDFAQPLPFSSAKCYFTHYLYHTANEVNEVAAYAPYETFWLKTFPYSDERHWANMGMEVLPASTSWGSLAALSAPAAPIPVHTGVHGPGVSPENIVIHGTEMAVTAAAGQPTLVDFMDTSGGMHVFSTTDRLVSFASLGFQPTQATLTLTYTPVKTRGITGTIVAIGL